MNIVICDACKKSIPGPVNGRNYKTLLNKDLCFDCFDKLEDNVLDVVEKTGEFHINSYNENRKDILNRMTR